MVKAINILLLFFFMNFVSAPTIAVVFDIDLPTASLNFSEEEETHSSCKKNISVAEEEELKYLSNFYLPILSEELTYKNNFKMETIHSINDDLVLKIPSPPPESV